MGSRTQSYLLTSIPTERWCRWFREVKWPTQDHTASKEHREDSLRPPLFQDIIYVPCGLQLGLLGTSGVCRSVLGPQGEGDVTEKLTHVELFSHFHLLFWDVASNTGRLKFLKNCWLIQHLNHINVKTKAHGGEGDFMEHSRSQGYWALSQRLPRGPGTGSDTDGVQRVFVYTKQQLIRH